MTVPPGQQGRDVALLREVEAATHTGSWMFTVVTGELLWSPNLFRIFGRPAELGPPSLQALSHLIHAADRERFVAFVDGMREHGRPKGLRYRAVIDGTVRHLHAKLAVVERDAAGAPSRLVGVVQDVTEQHRAEQQIDAHLAVSDAIAAWDGLEPGAQRLLAGLAGAMSCAGGVLWAPEDGDLVARVVWRDPTVDFEPFWAATRETRLKPSAGVAGIAWARREPVLDEDGSLMRSGPRGESAVRAGLGADLAIPALVGDEVVAVVELPLREDGHITDRLMRSLVGIGHELGQFLGRRRGELGASRLTARELEVLQLASRGLSTRQTAEALFLSPATVKTHLGHIYTKLGVPERAAAVATALRLGLIA